MITGIIEDPFEFTNTTYDDTMQEWKMYCLLEEGEEIEQTDE